MKILSRPLVLAALASILVLAPLSEAGAACNHSVDPKKAVVFVGLNEFFAERGAAAEGACARGESFYSIPAPVEGEEVAVKAFYEREKATDELQAMQSTSDTCYKISAQTPSENQAQANCEAARQKKATDLQAKIDAANLIYTPYLNKLQADANSRRTNDDFTKLMQSLAAKKIQPTAIVLSGHSTGPYIYGKFGRLEFADAQLAVQQAYAAKPALLNSLDDVLLWGCNTMNPFHGGDAWVKFLPTLKMIFGFEGTAPGAKNAASPELLKSVLTRSIQLKTLFRAKAPDDQLKALFDSLPGIEYTIGSAYLNDPRDNRAFYYERKEQRTYNQTLNQSSESWTSTVQPAVSEAQCESVHAEISADQDKLQNLLESNSTEIPAETGTGELRELYTRFRKNEPCRVKFGYSYSADQAAYVLFWNGVKKNAARFYGPTLQSRLDAITAHLNGTEIADTAERLKKYEADSRAQKIADLQYYITAYQGYVAKATALYEAYKNLSGKLPWSPKLDDRLTKDQATVTEYENSDAFRSPDLEQVKKSRAKLDQMNLEIQVLQELKETADYTGDQLAEMVKQELNQLASNRDSYKNGQKEYQDRLDTAQNAPAYDPTASLEEIRSAIQAVATISVPTSAAAADPIGYAEFKRRMHAAGQTLVALEEKTDNSSAFYGIRSDVDSASQTLRYYSEIAIRLNPNCMSVDTWHEYEETPEHGLPTTSCVR
jgi:hypothetical protein